MGGCLEFIVKEVGKAGLMAGAIAAGNYFLGREFEPRTFLGNVGQAYMVMTAAELVIAGIKNACGYNRRNEGW